MAEATAQQSEMPKQGEFCWTEIAVGNLEACKNFYQNVFGWSLKQSDATGETMQYLEYSVGENYPMGGIYEMTEEICGGTPPPPHFMTYISVDNVDETTAKVESLGGKIVKQPENIPNVGRFSIIQDPTGANVALLTLQSTGV